MIKTLPEPLVHAHVDLRNFPFMPLDVQRLRSSDLAAMEKPDACWAAVMLWCASWHQVPAASLPDDDRVLANLAGYGRDVKRWGRVRAGALRGFVKAEDGRLYHPIIAEKALEAWLEKVAQRISGGEGNAKRWGLTFDRTLLDADLADARRRLEALNPQSRALMKIQTASPPDSPPDSQRDRKGQGQGQGHKPKPAAAAPPVDPVKDEIWKTGKGLLEAEGMNRERAGSFLGKLCKDFGQVLVLRAVRDCVTTTPAKPSEWLVARCQERRAQGAAGLLPKPAMPCGNCGEPLTGGWTQSPKGRVCDACYNGYMNGGWPAGATDLSKGVGRAAASGVPPSSTAQPPAPELPSPVAPPSTDPVREAQYPQYQEILKCVSERADKRFPKRADRPGWEFLTELVAENHPRGLKWVCDHIGRLAKKVDCWPLIRRAKNECVSKGLYGLGAQEFLDRYQFLPPDADHDDAPRTPVTIATVAGSNSVIQTGG